jgi:hypothetical protein
MDALSEWIIVVRPDRPDLHESLRRLFETDRRVEVVFDRRTVPPRGEPPPAGRERRRPRARRGLTPKQAARWEAGFRILHRDAGYDVYSAEPAPTTPGSEANQTTD